MCIQYIFKKFDFCQGMLIIVRASYHSLDMVIGDLAFSRNYQNKETLALKIETGLLLKN